MAPAPPGHRFGRVNRVLGGNPAGPRARLLVVVPDRRTMLVEENRRESLGLAVNWGFRFLLAYALEIKPSRTGDRTMRDLQWVHSLIGTGAM